MSIYQPRDQFRPAFDSTRCAARVRARRIGAHQCSNKCRADLSHEGHFWCAVHFPPKVKEKNEKRERERHAAHDYRVKRSEQEARQRRAEEAALAAIRQIAAGHNDPGALARQVLKDAGE